MNAVRQPLLRVFQSTPSSRRATILAGIRHKMFTGFQSTPSSRRATYIGLDEFLEDLISIHALLTEGDDENNYTLRQRANFNPRPPHGGRLMHIQAGLNSGTFQSTPSSRRATQGFLRITRAALDFNPRPPHGGRPSSIPGFELTPGISIHALLTEGDQIKRYRSPMHQFQSTPSSRRATAKIYNDSMVKPIFLPKACILLIQVCIVSTMAEKFFRYDTIFIGKFWCESPHKNM